jgi:hypothetical protein
MILLAAMILSVSCNFPSKPKPTTGGETAVPIPAGSDSIYFFEAEIHKCAEDGKVIFVATCVIKNTGSPKRFNVFYKDSTSDRIYKLLQLLPEKDIYEITNLTGGGTNDPTRYCK